MKQYPTPAAFKMALEERIRTLARQQGEDMNRLRQMLIFDRIIARISAELGDSIVLKGGLVLEIRLGRARTTRDVDLRAEGAPRLVIERIRRAGQVESPDHLHYEFSSAEDPLDGDGLVYEGIRLRAQATLAGRIYGAPFGVDVAFGDVLTQPPQWVFGSSLLSFAGIEPPRFQIYPRETHLAEKLHAYTLPRPRENSRVKDLPDLSLLATTGTYEAMEVRTALEAPGVPPFAC